MSYKLFKILSALLSAVSAIVFIQSCGESSIYVPLEVVNNGRADGGQVGEERDITDTGTLLVGLEKALLSSSQSMDSDEKRIERWAYWVFDNETKGCVKCGEGSDTSAQIRIMSGSYIVSVIANYPLSGPYALEVTPGVTYTQLMSFMTDISDNRSDALVMYGAKSVTVLPDETTKKSIPLTRLVSKVGVEKITIDFSDKDLIGKWVFLRSIYLTNVSRRSRYGSDYTSANVPSGRSEWYNVFGWRAADVAVPSIDALVGDIDIKVNGEYWGTSVNGASMTTPHYFYTYPNPVEAANDVNDVSSWSLRSSRLVIELCVCAGSGRTPSSPDVKTYYYVINIPSMKRNTPYIASDVIIRGKGSLDPEKPTPDVVDVQFATSVEGWEGVPEVTEES